MNDAWFLYVFPSMITKNVDQFLKNDAWFLYVFPSMNIITWNLWSVLESIVKQLDALQMQSLSSTYNLDYNYVSDYV